MACCCGGARSVSSSQIGYGAYNYVNSYNYAQSVIPLYGYGGYSTACCVLQAMASNPYRFYY